MGSMSTVVVLLTSYLLKLKSTIAEIGDLRYGRIVDIRDMTAIDCVMKHCSHGNSVVLSRHSQHSVVLSRVD
jgi:hypothetical protein